MLDTTEQDQEAYRPRPLMSAQDASINEVEEAMTSLKICPVGGFTLSKLR